MLIIFFWVCLMPSVNIISHYCSQTENNIIYNKSFTSIFSTFNFCFITSSSAWALQLCEQNSIIRSIYQAQCSVNKMRCDFYFDGRKKKNYDWSFEVNRKLNYIQIKTF